MCLLCLFGRPSLSLARAPCSPQGGGAQTLTKYDSLVRPDEAWMTAPDPSISDSGVPGWTLRICISNSFQMMLRLLVSRDQSLRTTAFRKLPVLRASNRSPCGSRQGCQLPACSLLAHSPGLRSKHGSSLWTHPGSVCSHVSLGE